MMFHLAPIRRPRKLDISRCVSESSAYVIAIGVPEKSDSSLFCAPFVPAERGLRASCNWRRAVSALAVSCFCLSNSVSAVASRSETVSTLAWALSAATPAASAELFAVAAATAAPLADAFASPASLESTVLRSPFAFLIFVSTDPIFAPTHNSPVTPIATRADPNNPKTSNAVLGLSAGRMIPRRKACKSSRYSQTTNMTSSATPMTTRSVQKNSQESSEDRQISRLSSSILSADSSIQHLRDRQVLMARIQLTLVSIIWSLGTYYSTSFGSDSLSILFSLIQHLPLLLPFLLSSPKGICFCPGLRQATTIRVTHPSRLCEGGHPTRQTRHFK